MLTAHHLTKSFGVEPILDEVTFSISAGERVGLVGPNGAGKTTLLRLLAGLDQPDAGSVQLVPPHLRLGYLPQGLVLEADQTLAGFLNRTRNDEADLAAEVARLAGSLAQSPGVLNPSKGAVLSLSKGDLQREYERALARLAATAPDEGRVASVLSALGLEQVPLSTPVVVLSGGQKTRLALASVLLADPQLLLLDEPTNHLDLLMLEWLEEWLNDFPGAALVVSHDRTFLDRTVSRILELDPQTHSVREYTGNYSAYFEQKVAERERQWDRWRDQEADIRRIRQDIAQTKEQAAWVERTTTSRQPNVRRYAKKVARKAKSREKKLDRYLESDERVDKPKAGWQMSVEFGDAPASGQDVLVLDNLSVGYEARALLTGLNRHIRQGERVALMGPNGAGKSTLVRTIAGELAPLAGRARLGANVRVGYMAQEQTDLDPDLNALTTIRALSPLTETEARSFLHRFLFSGDDVFVPVRSLSFGQRSRLELACLVARGCNFLLLDEPINHLDISSRARFEQALSSFEGTVLAVAHDRYFVERFATTIWDIADGSIHTRD